MKKSMMAVIAMALGLAAMPAAADEAHHTGKTKAASTAKAQKMDSLGGGSACKDGKCGSKAGGKGGMGGCCCAGMMGQMQGGKMGMMGDHDSMGMKHDDQAGADHAVMMERMRKMEERMEMMQKMMMEQKARG